MFAVPCIRPKQFVGSESTSGAIVESGSEHHSRVIAAFEAYSRSRDKVAQVTPKTPAPIQTEVKPTAINKPEITVLRDSDSGNCQRQNQNNQAEHLHLKVIVVRMGKGVERFPVSGWIRQIGGRRRLIG